MGEQNEGSIPVHDYFGHCPICDGECHHFPAPTAEQRERFTEAVKRGRAAQIEIRKHTDALTKHERENCEHGGEFLKESPKTCLWCAAEYVTDAVAAPAVQPVASVVEGREEGLQGLVAWLRACGIASWADAVQALAAPQAGAAPVHVRERDELNAIAAKLDALQDKYDAACESGEYEGPQFNEVFMLLADRIRAVPPTATLRGTLPDERENALRALAAFARTAPGRLPSAVQAAVDLVPWANPAAALSGTPEQPASARDVEEWVASLPPAVPTIFVDDEPEPAYDDGDPPHSYDASV